MLTLARCEQVLLEVFGGYESVPADTSTLELVNATGHWFVDANSWSWSRRIGNVSTIASQNYVDLASVANFRKLYSLVYSDGVSTWLNQCDLAYIIRLRTGIAGFSARPEYAAVSFANEVTTGAITRRLELYPTPSTSLTDAITLFYAAGWTEAASYTQLPIPPQVEGLFLQALRTHALGWRMHEAATTARRLAELVAGPQWAAAVLSDAATQTNFGQIKNSDIQVSGDLPTRWMTGTVPDP